MKQKRGVKEKLIFNVLIISFFCFGLLGIIACRQVAALMITQSKEDAMSLVEVAAGEVDGDELLSITSEKDEAYQDICQKLNKYTQSRIIEYIYTMKKDGDGLCFVVDADPEEPAAVGEAYEFLPAMRDAFNGDVSCDDEITSDHWGTYYSAYAPVYNSKGEIVAIVGCDININSINAKVDDMRDLIMVLVSGFACVCFLSYSGVSRNIMKKDPLTEVLIYDNFLKVGNRLIRRRKITEYSCLVLNIKDFKYINQRLGSADSDLILRGYAKTIKGFLQRREYIARTGSDNFAVLIKKKNEEKLLELLSDMKLSMPNGSSNEVIQIYSRCGIFRVENIHSMDDIMNGCTVAINEARVPTADDYVVFEDWMFENMVEENRILNEFKIGMQRNEFVAFYQPKVDANTNTLCGAEALVRWFKGGKMIPPYKFIPLLEKDGRIVELDFYVFKKVCQDIAYWQSQGLTPVRISSNFSKLHLKDPDFANHILNIVDKYQIDPKYLEIELTESSGYSDQEALTAFVNKMNEANIFTSIDDFGTGYSSLSMLKDINVDVIKIDKSFIDSISEDENSHTKMIQNVIKMVKDLQREVICEGVETSIQLEFLKTSGCHIIQGYLYDKPLPHREFEDRLRSPEYTVS